MTKVQLLDNINKADTTDKRLEIVQKFLFHGTPFVFDGREGEYFEFRRKIANKFKIGFHEVFIIGSAKLGYSYHKESDFSYNSDIDIVIVSEKLFDDFHMKISEYQYQLEKQHLTINQNELMMYNSFLRYLVKGWMRPDKLPTSFQVKALKNDWFDFFASLSYGKSEVGNYKVAAGLYKNYEYLEKYYSKGLEDIFNSTKVK